MTICPHCVRTIQEDWKEFGTPPEVEHHSEFLARHLGELKLASGDAFRDLGKTDSEGGFVSGHEFTDRGEGIPENGSVSGHKFTDRVEGIPESGSVSGLDFSRAENVDKTTRALAPEGKIVFHDPCYLGRYRNVYDEPRRVAALAGELR